MFAKAKWIWKAGEILADEFADFVTEFDATGITPTKSGSTSAPST